MSLYGFLYAAYAVGAVGMLAATYVGGLAGVFIGVFIGCGATVAGAVACTRWKVVHR